MKRLFLVLTLLALTGVAMAQPEALAIHPWCNKCTVDADCSQPQFCGARGGVCFHESRSCGPYKLCVCN